MTPLLALALALAASPEEPRELPRLVVLDFKASGGLTPDVAESFSDLVTTEVGASGFFKVLSSRDLVALLGLERQKQLLGCGETSSSCMSELTGALDARYALSGSLAKVGDQVQLSLQTLDARSAQPLGRSLRIARSLEALRRSVPFLVAEATGTPRPPAPSKVLPVSLLVAGGVTVVGGGVVGFNALNREAVAAAELNRGVVETGTLRSLQYYRDEAASIGRDKTIAAVALGSGAALLLAGALLMPKDPAEASFVLVPTFNGAALVGVFP